MPPVERSARAEPPQAADRLQPALLDRLTDRSSEAGEHPRYMSRQALRAAILRDLGWLLNALQPLPADQAEAHPRAAASVLNFGLPPLAGELASRVDVLVLQQAIFEAIVRYEPRILPGSLSVRALRLGEAMDAHNVIEFEILGQTWARPVPLDILLRTRLDLEGGRIDVREVQRSAAAEGLRGGAR